MPAWTWPATSEPPDHGSATHGVAASTLAVPAAPKVPIAPIAPAAPTALAPAGRRRRGSFGCLLCVACALPLLWHAVRVLRGEAGADPLQVLIHASGFWALALLLATLSVTPLRRASVWLARAVAVRFGRRISDWNFLVRQRRALGLWSFFYAALHVALHTVLEAGSLAELWQDASERRFILFGLAAFALLVPLAATSTQGWMRRLKRSWSRLHLLVYPAAALALAHLWWQTKLGHERPWGFAGLAAVLLVARLMSWWAGDRRRAAEWPERSGPNDSR